MKQFNNDAEIKYTIAAIQCNIDKYRVDLECNRQKLRILDNEIRTELFSKKPVECMKDMEIITEKIIEIKKELEKSNESLSNLHEAEEEK